MALRSNEWYNLRFNTHLCVFFNNVFCAHCVYKFRQIIFFSVVIPIVTMFSGICFLYALCEPVFQKRLLRRTVAGFVEKANEGNSPTEDFRNTLKNFSRSIGVGEKIRNNCLNTSLTDGRLSLAYLRGTCGRVAYREILRALYNDFTKTAIAANNIPAVVIKE